MKENQEANGSSVPRDEPKKVPVCPFCGALPQVGEGDDEGFVLCATDECVIEGAWVSVKKWSVRADLVAPQTFQSRVMPWLLECFGAEIAADKVERNHRFLEEALELVQACGCTQDEAHQLVAYVYGRPQGDVNQEVGGVMVTLAALCLANGLDMHSAGETELARVWTKVETIRAKQAAKPKHSPLPLVAPQGLAECPVKGCYIMALHHHGEPMPFNPSVPTTSGGVGENQASSNEDKIPATDRIGSAPPRAVASPDLSEIDLAAFISKPPSEWPQLITWEPLNRQSFNAEFSGYKAAPYCTGNPELGWCLYSRGAGGCWNQRTEKQYPPRAGAEPRRHEGRWYWIFPEIQRTNTAKPVDSNAAVDSSVLIFADGYCGRCSELSRPLTSALAITGVPTGAANWQQTYGLNKVRALTDYEHCLRRLVNVMNDPQSKQAAIAEARGRAEFYFEFHARRAQATASSASDAPLHDIAVESSSSNDYLRGGCTDSECRLCHLAPYARRPGMSHAGIPSVVKRQCEITPEQLEQGRKFIHENFGPYADPLLRALCAEQSVPSGQREAFDAAIEIAKAQLFDPALAEDGFNLDCNIGVTTVIDALTEARDAVPAPIGYDQRTLEAAARVCELNFVATQEPLHSYRGGLNEAARRYAREIRALATTPAKGEEGHGK